MHADTLYHRMLEQEEAIESAKAEGRPLPAFEPLLKPSSRNNAAQSPTIPIVEPNLPKYSHLPPAMQDEIKERLKDLTDKDRELEERVITAELEAGEQVAGYMDNIHRKQAKERQMRKEMGKETIGDKFSSIFGFR